jgi:3-oxoacyl-[acyl-carrier-protein] synthase-3
VFALGISEMGFHVPGERLAVSAILGGEPDDPAARSPLLRPPEYRHHVAADTTAAELVLAAAEPMFARRGLAPREIVDVLITNCLLPDNPITGCGAAVAAGLGVEPEWVVDLHNGGCGSFPYMLKLAAALMESGTARGALLCNVQNTAGQVFSQPTVKHRNHALAAGDGSAVALLERDAPSPVIGTAVCHDPLAAADMDLAIPGGRKYWEAGGGEVDIAFDPAHVETIVKRGNTAVPTAVRALCADIGVRPQEIDVLITNQPNRMFLRNWRRALEIPSERHLDTFDRYGNLYGVGAPLTLAAAAGEGRLPADGLVVLAGFAHAGDFAAAAAIRWQAARGAAYA